MVAEVRAISVLPPDIGELAVAAELDGHELVSRLVDEWRDGSNRFDRPGEVLAEVRCGDVLCAIGGLNVDPYLDDVTVGRIRHVFVHPSWRRTGMGRILIEFLVARAASSFQRVRLRTGRAPGPDFYEELGFATSDEPDATHVLSF